MIAASAGPVHAQPAESTIDRVRREGVLRCGSAIRPGLAFPAADQSWNGLLVDICQAVASATIGPGARIDYTGYAPGAAFGRARGADDLAFLTGGEIFANSLFDGVQPGPAVFVVTSGVMVWTDSRLQHVADLGSGAADAGVCAEPGTSAERNLMAYAAGHGMTLRYSGWQELEEMTDAFDVGRCPAMAGELTALAALRLYSDAAGHPARILPETLGATPMLAVTGQGDPRWSALVAWTVQALLASDDPRAAALPLDGAAIGLAPGWLARLTQAGTYAAIFDRDLGAGSVLGLPRGVNARWDAGGTLLPASVE